MRTDSPGAEPNDWLERCRAGDNTAWRRLYDEHFPLVFRLAIRMGASDREAADIAQEVFLRVWRGLANFRGDAQLRTWLYRITLNETARYGQKAGLRRKLSTLMNFLGATTEPLAPAADWAAERAEGLVKINRVLAQLKPTQRTVFVLFEIEELSLEKIAEVMDCPLETVRSRLRLARADFERLRKKGEEL